MRIKELVDFVAKNKETVSLLLTRYRDSGKTLFLRSEMWEEFQRFCLETENEWLLASPLNTVFSKTHRCTAVDVWRCSAAVPDTT